MNTRPTRKLQKPPEPRNAQLLGLNLTDQDLSRLTQLLHSVTSNRRRAKNKLSLSRLAYDCFKTGLHDYTVHFKNNTRPPHIAPHDLAKRQAKLIGIYLSQTDLNNLYALDQLYLRRFWGRHRPPEDRGWFDKPSTLAYRCFRHGLHQKLAPTH